MTTLSSVPSTPDPKERARSEVRFPYYNLDSSAEVATAIHTEAGGACDRSQLASFLKYKSITNGSFLTRVTAAKLFGFISQQGNQLSLTDLGRRVAAPIAANDVARAKAEAFLNVELFKKVFDATDGQTLPPALGLRNMLLTKYGVLEARVGPATKVMLDSAEQAGYFRNGDRTRLVRPMFAAGAPSASTVVTPEPKTDQTIRRVPDDERRGGNGGGGGGGDDESLKGIDPALVALLRRLPASGTAIGKNKREKLIAAFTAAVNWIYPDPDADDDF